MSQVEVGDLAPEFRLPSTKGEVGLADFTGGVVLYFIREFGCMTCQMHAAALVKAYVELRGAGFEVVVVGGGSEADAVKMGQRIKAPFPVAADVERSTYGRYGVDKALLVIQRSAAFVVDSDGHIVYAHRSMNPAGGLDLPSILEVVRHSSSVPPGITH